MGDVFFHRNSREMHMIRSSQAFLFLLGSALAMSPSSRAGTGQDTLHELDQLAQSLDRGQIVTIPDIRRIFRVTGKGVLTGHWQYGKRTSDITEFHAFAGQPNEAPGIVKIAAETMGEPKAILRLTIAMDKKACLNAKTVIARYDLKDAPPPDPAPYASSVRFARGYGTANLWVDIPVQPARIPETQLNKSSCVSSIGVYIGSPPRSRS
jgi:hypothetical protein